jgi:hypothetical protein
VGWRTLTDALDVSREFPDPSDESIVKLVGDIDRVGYATIPSYTRERDLDEVRAFVKDAVAKAKNEYVCFTGSKEVTGTVLERMANSPIFGRLCTRIYEVGTGKPAPRQPYHQILRCLSGQTGQSHSLRFHYDSYVLTALLPIAIPAGTCRGDLIIFPNMRRVRTRYARNVIDKLMIDNPLSQTLLKYQAVSNPSRTVRIKLTPGDLYLFWGYRSVHANEPSDPDKIRATALFHYGDPHQHSMIKRALRS